jgi:hypothetical protein
VVAADASASDLIAKSYLDEVAPTRQPVSSVRVEVESGAEPSEVDAVRAALEEAGIAVEDQTERIAKVGGVEVVILVVVFLGGAYLKGFFTRLGELHAESANRVLQELVRKLWAARNNRATPELQSEADRISIRLDPDLPEEAPTALLAGDFPDQAASGVLIFDHKAGRWRDSWEVAREKNAD